MGDDPNAQLPRRLSGGRAQGPSEILTWLRQEEGEGEERDDPDESQDQIARGTPVLAFSKAKEERDDQKRREIFEADANPERDAGCDPLLVHEEKGPQDHEIRWQDVKHSPYTGNPDHERIEEEGRECEA